VRSFGALSAERHDVHIQGRNLPMQIAWHSLAILSLLCLPVLKLKALWWDLSLRNLAPVEVSGCSVRRQRV
jgi:hypothetical protein